ncbi:MAG: hypothetical protein L6V93_22035 [Clostridiales bacterium]|nr:MAG: hypothetical protein L6V93_22035 [Clostridiales bacterium]
MNVVTIPVTDVSDGQSVSVTVSDESVLEYIGGNKFKVKGVSVSPVTVNVKITENGEETSSKRHNRSVRKHNGAHLNRGGGNRERS